ncbi:MAG: PKD domain-containing protein [Candidatus Bipolaricaulota bacterium]
MKKTILWIMLVAAFGAIALGQVEPRGIIIEPPEPDGLTVSVRTDKPVYQVGEAAQIHFEINRSAYIYIWDIRPNGEVARIFPNQYDTENYFQAGEHTIPTPGTYRMTVDPPLGTEWLQILAVTEPFPFQQLGEDPEELEAQALGLVPEQAEEAFDFTSFEIVDAAPPTPGTLRVSSSPSLARFYVDGVFRGWTPREVQLEPGSYRILLRKDGYRDYTTQVWITSGRTRTLSVELSRVRENQPPVARFDFDPERPDPEQWIQFDAGDSYDPDGPIVRYEWDVGNDGRINGTGRVFFHMFTTSGPRSVRLIVTDDEGATGETTRTVRVGVVHRPPVARFTYSPADPFVGMNVTFDAGDSYAPDGSITSYRWDLTGDGNINRTGRVVNWTYTSEGTYPVTLHVRDNQGETAQTTQSVQVRRYVSPLPPGMPDMGTTPGIYVWGTDNWNITVNGSPRWGNPRPYRVELRTDGRFVGVSTDTSAAPLGLEPEPTEEGWRLVFEGSVRTGRVTHTFQVRDASSIWMDLRLDMNGDGTADRRASAVRFRRSMVTSPYNPVVLGLQRGDPGPLVPAVNFRLGRTIGEYTEHRRIVFYLTTIETLEAR